MMDVNSTTMIKQHNVITTAKYEYSLFEQRIIYVVAFQLNKAEASNNDLFGEVMIDVPIKSVLKYEIDDNETFGSKNYDVVKHAAKKLQSRVVELRETLPSGKKCWTVTNMITSAQVVEGSGIIRVTVNPMVVPYFAELFQTKEVTEMNFKNALTLKSIYSQRFYAFISRFKDTGWWKVSVEELREMMKLEGKYPAWDSLKRVVIDTAQKELEKKSDVYFKYYARKTGKQITHLEFKIFTRKKDETVGGGGEGESVDGDELTLCKARMAANPKVLDGLKRVGLSLSQIKQIFSKAEPAEISTALYEIQIAKSNNKIRNTMAAYSWGVMKGKFLTPKAA